MVSSTAPLFCLFVLALGVVVRAASDRGLGHTTAQLLPSGSSLPALLGVATVLDSSHTFRLVALGLLVLVTAAGARPGLSRVIDSVAPLRRLDAAGRV